MATRHKFKAAPLDKGLSADWNDDHHFDPTDEVDWSTDFVNEMFDDVWDDGDCSGGGNVGASMTDNHLFADVDSGAGVGDIASMQKISGLGVGDFTNKLDLPVLTMAVKIEDPTGAGNTHEFGFFRSADTPFTANQRGIYFRIAGGKLYAVTGDGANEEANDITPAVFAINKYMVLRIEVGSTAVYFYVDDLVTYECGNTTHIPTENLTIKLSTIGIAAGANILRSDFIGLSRLRKK